MMQSIVNNAVMKGFTLFTIEIQWNQTLPAGHGHQQLMEAAPGSSLMWTGPGPVHISGPLVPQKEPCAGPLRPASWSRA